MSSFHNNRFVSLLILLLIGFSAWPAFVIVNIFLGYFLGEGSIIELWNQEPKRNLINSFFDGYIASAVIAVPLGVVAALDYLILARSKITGFFTGISVPIFCVTLAYFFYKEPTQVLLSFLVTGFVLWVCYKTVDIGFRLRRNH